MESTSYYRSYDMTQFTVPTSLKNIQNTDSDKPSCTKNRLGKNRGLYKRATHVKTGIISKKKLVSSCITSFQLDQLP